MAEPGLEERVAKLEGRVDGFDARFDGLERRFEAMDGLLRALDQKVSKQFYWVVGIQVTVLVAVVTALAGALLTR
ncbi:MAG: hypothetical protein ACE5JG_10950 [Planctomycetota bacterium]